MARRTSERAGSDLRSIVEEALGVRAALDALHSRYSRSVIEQAAIAGALNPEVLSNAENARAAASYIARRLDASWKKAWIRGLGTSKSTDAALPSAVVVQVMS